MIKDSVVVVIGRVTWPVLISLLAVMTYQLADTYFISYLGSEALAVLGFALPIQLGITTIAYSLGTAATTVVAKSVGQQQLARARTIGRDVLLMGGAVSLICSLILQLLLPAILVRLGADESLIQLGMPYFAVWVSLAIFQFLFVIGSALARARGKTLYPAIVGTIGAITNIILDPIFIFGFGPVPASGITGAAIATAISWLISCVLLFLGIAQQQIISFTKPDMQTMAAAWKQCCKIAIPVCGANLVIPLADGILTRLVSNFGHNAVAAWAVANRIEFLALLLTLALALTLPSFISQNFGASKFSRVKQAYYYCCGLIIIWQLIVALLLFLVPENIAAKLSSNSESAAMVAMFLLIVPISYGFRAINMFTVNLFYGFHQPLKGVILVCIRLFFSLDSSGVDWSKNRRYLWGFYRYSCRQYACSSISLVLGKDLY